MPKVFLAHDLDKRPLIGVEGKNFLAIALAKVVKWDLPKPKFLLAKLEKTKCFELGFTLSAPDAARYTEFVAKHATDVTLFPHLFKSGTTDPIENSPGLSLLLRSKSKECNNRCTKFFWEMGLGHTNTQFVAGRENEIFPVCNELLLFAKKLAQAQKCEQTNFRMHFGKYPWMSNSGLVAYWWRRGIRKMGIQNTRETITPPFALKPAECFDHSFSFNNAISTDTTTNLDSDNFMVDIDSYNEQSEQETHAEPDMPISLERLKKQCISFKFSTRGMNVRNNKRRLGLLMCFNAVPVNGVLHHHVLGFFEQWDLYLPPTFHDMASYYFEAVRMII
ncbi:hypothetical protein DFP72DRAFT_849519 [Ephemerocybe angulata]|uniref:Uncharacterized protein n=1 Tax=Ephemerocybe angulata TaxID=980116 RepID=A0A8H6M4E7_9AGAR|nr:hypothetical protein DFP72DRAFT_849519 [Tulosesus angulatus]